MIVAAIEWMTTLEVATARIYAATMMAVVVSLDDITGRSVSLNGLYMLVLCFTAWTLRERTGLIVGLCCATITVLLNGFGDGMSVAATNVPIWAAAWNFAMRLFGMTLIVVLIGSFRQHFEQERTLARTDPLTGLLNKRAFFEQARESLAHAARKRRSTVLAYVDLDGFKAVNDRFGHAAGDALLSAFARAATGKLGAHELAGRIGGDEFVFLLTVPSDSLGTVVAERIHSRLSACLGHAPCPVTCSTGALVIEPPWLEDGEELARLADALMYEVKRAGKDAVRIAILGAMRAEPLRVAYPPITDDAFDELLRRLDRSAPIPRRDAA